MAPVVFLDGLRHSPDGKLLARLKPGGHYRRGVFETMRAYDGRLFYFENHIERFFRGLSLYRISFSPSVNVLRRRCREAALRVASPHVRIRLSAWGDKAETHWAIVAQKDPLPAAAQLAKGWRVCPVRGVRSQSRVSHIKSLNYQVFLNAAEEARRNGYDEGILLNGKREIVEGSRTNIFFVRGNTLMTPPVSSGCLNGITRQAVIRVAGKLGFRVSRRPLTLRDVSRCDEVFVTNSSLLLMPVRVFGRRRFIMSDDSAALRICGCLKDDLKLSRKQ